ncbi:hypothetical protein CCACVL1_30695, partial [Corchorus capsularis]
MTLLFDIVNVYPADIMLELALQIIVVNLRDSPLLPKPKAMDIRTRSEAEYIKAATDLTTRSEPEYIKARSKAWHLRSETKSTVEMIGLGVAMMSSLFIDGVNYRYAIVLLITHLSVVMTPLFNIAGMCPGDIMLELALQIIMINLRGNELLVYIANIM